MCDPHSKQISELHSKKGASTQWVAGALAALEVLVLLRRDVPVPANLRRLGGHRLIAA